MKDIQEEIVKALIDGNVVMVITAVVLAIVFNLKKILAFIDDRKKVRITRLTEALACEFIDNSTKKHLQNELAKELCKSATGVAVESKFRKKIFETHDKMNGEVSFIHFTRAMPYFKFEKETLSIHISKFESVSYVINYFGFFIAMLGFAGTTLALLSEISHPNSTNLLILLITNFSLLTAGIFMITETFSIRSAKMISKRIQGS